MTRVTGRPDSFQPCVGTISGMSSDTLPLIEPDEATVAKALSAGTDFVIATMDRLQ